MVRYRRSSLPGGTYFFTVTLHDRGSRVLVENIAPLRDAFRAVRRRHPFEILAIVVLPDHLHAIWRLPAGDADYPNRWRAIKARFTTALLHSHGHLHHRTTGERMLWQRRYWEHAIRDEQDLQRHVDYIHFNPVKHGWVATVAEWPYSSFHRYVGRGILPREWGGTAGEGEFGEP